MERKYKLYQDVAIDTVAETTEGVLVIEGMASYYRHDSGDGKLVVDRENEIVNTDNIDLTNYLKNPVLCYGHNWEKVVGKTVDITKEFTGIKVRAEVHRLTGFEHVYEGVQKGLLNAFSIGFIPKSLDFYEQGYDEFLMVDEAELIEISIVGVPANPDSLFNVIGSKSLGFSKSLIKKQTGLECKDLQCLLKSTTNNKGEAVQKDATENIIEDAKEEIVTTKGEDSKVEDNPKEVVEEVISEVKEEPKQEAKPDDGYVYPDPKKIAEALLEAQRMKEEQDKEKEANAKEEEEQKLQKQQEDKAEFENNVLTYISTQTERVQSIDALELDIEEFEGLYDNAAALMEAIESKITEAKQRILDSEDN